MAKRIDSRETGTSSDRTRKCLRCGRPFASEGIHNRLCIKCKASPDFRGAVDTASYYRGSRR